MHKREPIFLIVEESISPKKMWAKENGLFPIIPENEQLNFNSAEIKPKVCLSFYN